jgi:hypothetical protein
MIDAATKAQPWLRSVGGNYVSMGTARHLSAFMALLDLGVLCNRPTFGKQQPCFGSRQIDRVARGMGTKINTVNHFRKLFD